MSKKTWSILIIAVLLLCLFGLVSTMAAPPKGVRFIVQLEAPALLKWSEVSVMGGGGKIDANSPTAQEYIEQLRAQQAAFVTSLEKAIPGASLSRYIDEKGVAHDLSYQIALNGVTVTLPDSSSATLKRLARLPGVKAIYPEQEYGVDLDVSHDYMGSSAMWDAAGGQANAGAGIKVAVLDTGIDEEHPFFDPTGFTYPPGFPKGDSRYTTEKVIAARGYYRADDPPANPGPTDYDSHGTGTSGIIAGNLDTTSVISNAFSTITKTVSGVAPAAQLMNYQLFYTSVSGSQSAWTPEILMAIEDMVADGADVSNNSWGGVDNLAPAVDPIGVAFQNAVDAGVIVVKSAGNSGPEYHSLGDAMPQSLIIAGGNDFGRRVGASASVTGPGTVPSELTNMLAIEADFTPALTGVLTGTYVYVGRTDPANFEGCNPFDATTAAAVEGNIALISRGGCRFDAKVQNADDAGAVAAIIFNNLPGDLPFTMSGDPRDIPAVMLGNEAGWNMADWEADNPATSTVMIDPALAYIPGAALPDTMYQSSSRGPDLAQEMGVDVIAPGSAAWTSYSTTGGWSTVNGTSFSAPFAAGAAAVLKQMYPTWEAANIESAMMGTAKNQGIYKDYAQTEHAGVLDMGAGRLQFDKMVDPGLVFDNNSSLSFKQMRAGTSKIITVVATDVFSRDPGTPFVYTVAISETGDITTTANFTLSVSPSSLTFDDDGDTASFDVTMEIPSDATPGDYEGWVWLRHGHHELHLPVWVRVRPEATEGHVLILDDDASAYGFPDYLDYYTNALDTLGYTYDVWLVDLENYFTGRGFPTVAEMQAYDKIVWFTGDSWYTYSGIGGEVQSRNDLFDVMRSGGAKVLATGMDLSGYEFGDYPGEYPLQVGMAAYFLQEDAYAPAVNLAPNPAIEGTSVISAFQGMVFDLGGLVITPTIETSAGNQFYVDELAPYEDAPELYGGKGFLRSLEPGSDGEGWVGILRSVGPTLENEGVLPGPDYRTAYLSFGLEGINDATGYTTREELLEEIFNFFQDELSVTLTVSGTGALNDLTTLTAEVESSVDAAGALYRWDFGDGSDIATTTTPSAVHLYRSGGTCTARVEVIDEYGHTAIDEAPVTIVASKIFLPFISKNYTPPTKITIFHTNDEEGWLQPYVAYGSPVTEGGAANLMGRFTQIEGYSPDADGFLLLSAGDMWTGPSISTWFQGESTVEVFNAMGYDAAAIGNHEFDFGRDALNERIAQADFPLLSANIYYTGTTDLADFTTPYIIKEVNGVKVGIVGLTTTSTPWVTHPKNISDLAFGDYEEALRREVPKMRAEGAEVIIVQAHVCLEPLSELAESVSDLDIDVMSAGHCSELDTQNTAVTLIIGGGHFMRSYAKTELFLDPVTHDVVDYTQSLILNQYVTEEGNPVTPDPEVQAIVDYWQTQTDEVMGEVIGYTETGMSRGSWKQGNYAMDSWLWAYPAADFAMTNWGGFRADIDAGDITVGDIVGVLPFENRIIDCAITGAQLVDNLECCGGAVAGFTYTYHEEEGQTVVDSVTLADSSPLVMTETYHVMVNDFMYMGGDNYLFGEQDPNGYDTSIQWRQPIIDWTKAQNTSATNPIDPLIDDQPRAVEITP
jgi:2',3'-cyclic-nucleotide 2'-phosphodiesterase (5'-nucleotidase family)/subtilisin family serine protease